MAFVEQHFELPYKLNASLHRPVIFIAMSFAVDCTSLMIKCCG